MYSSSKSLLFFGVLPGRDYSEDLLLSEVETVLLPWAITEPSNKLKGHFSISTVLKPCGKRGFLFSFEENGPMVSNMGNKKLILTKIIHFENVYAKE